MADNDVRIKVSLEGADQTAKGLAGVGDAASGAEGKTSKLSGGLKGAGVALVGFSVAAAAAGGALVAGVVSQYADYEQNIGGIETLFGSSAGKMQAYAAEAYKTAGLSANEYMSQVTSFSSSLLQSVGGDTDKAAEIANRAMTDMSDNANKFGTNIGMIQNAYQGFAKQNFTMLDNLKLGYGGTASEMARLVNDAGLMEDGFVATAENINSVGYDQIIASIGAVQDKLGVTGTTAKEAASTISGSVATMKGAFDNLLTGLGSADADVATLAGNLVASVEQVITNITPVIENIGTNIATLGPQLGTMMQSLVGALAAAVPTVLNAGVALIGGILQGITSALPSLITALIPGIVGLVQTVATLGPELITAGAQAIVALATGLANAAPTLIPAIVIAVLNMVDALIAALPMLLDAGLQLVMGLLQGIMTAVPMIVAALPGLIEGIVSFIISGVPMLLEAAIQLFTALITALPQVITQLVSALPTIITSIISALLGAIPLIIQAGITLITSLVTALPQIITTIVAALPQIITSIISAVLGAIPMIIQAGIDLLIALIGALPQIIVTIVQAIPQIITGVISALVGAIPQIISAGVQLLVALISNMPAILGGIISAIPQIIGGIVGAIVGAVPQLADAGLQLIRGLWNGISDAAGWLMGQIGGFVDDVVGGIRDFFGIKSPSTVMAEIGDYLTQGLAKGIKGGSKEVTKAADNMVEKVQEAMNDGLISWQSASKAVKAIRDNARQITNAIDARADIIAKTMEAREDLLQRIEDRQSVIDDIQGQVVDSGNFTGIKGVSTVEDMKKALEARITALREFRAKLAALQELGLDDATRDQFLEQFLKNGKSTAADTLLAGGKEAVDAISGLQNQLKDQGKKLGTLIGDDMYKAGIQVSQGLIQGLKSQSQELDKVAKSLASQLVGTVKKELGIRSPSRVFEDEIGAMIPAGLSLGINDGGNLAVKSIKDLNAKLMDEAMGLTSSMAFTHDATLTQTLIPMQAMAQQQGPLRVTGLDDLSSSLARQPESRINSGDMKMLAREVAAALLQVREEDGRSTELSMMMGVR